MASQLSSRQESTSYEKNLRRNRLRRILLESLERRELLASDLFAGPVFAPGTSQDYVDSVIAQFSRPDSGGEGGTSGGINLSGSRWTNPVGGNSPNQGDPASITWSIVPDGTTDSANGAASDLIFFMDSIYGGGTGPVEQRPWFNIFERAYDRWSEISGVNFVYEASDDGVPIGGGNRGVDGVRGDVRIGGRNIDGNSGVLAFNYLPTGGGNAGFDGDMIIDTNDVFYFNAADGPLGENRGLSNVLMHEAGHGLGILHTIPVNETKLMEPFISFAYLGPQHDDTLAVQALYGDAFENNDTANTATDLGELTNGRRTLAEVSINEPGDDDWYTFTAPSAGRISLTVAPTGESYDVGPQGGTTGPVNTLLNQDLSFELLASDGSVLASVDAVAAGEAEVLTDFDLPAGGTYRLRVMGVAVASSDPQLYDLTIRTSGLSGPGVVVEPPRLLAVSPNVGQIFSFNRTDELTLAPNEIQFRFDGAQLLDASSFDGIRITRAGHDGTFEDGNEVVVEPGFIGFGTSDRTIIVRFASTLPDDLYRIEVFGVDVPDEGISGVRNVNGDLLRPRVAGTDRDVVFFNLELGNQVIAVVPQPTARDASGNITQARDQIEVYFSDGDRMHDVDVVTGAITPNPTVVDPSFYRLFADRTTVTNTDDAIFLPTSVEYFADRNMALLTFADNIDELDPSQDTSFRLRVGTNEVIAAAPSVINQPADPGSTFNVTGAADLGVFTTLSSLEVSEQIVNNSVFPLDFPGAHDTPGSREVVDDPGLGESHFLGDSPDSDANLSVQFYNFNKEDPVSFNPITGQPNFNSISPAQEQRAREVFELYGSILGIQFIETADQGWTIGTADIDGVGGTIGVANGVSAIMDAAESWNDEFGANDEPSKFSWFIVAMHEIGHLLGLGHSTELPPGTIQGGAYSNTTLGGAFELLSGNPVEPIFPGAADKVNAQYLHRPDSRDIDMYRFEVAAGAGAGRFTAEVVAERLADSSLLDSVLTLYRELADGSREVVAVNDNYFSEDSYLQLDLEPGVYYLGVSASGNNNYNPEIQESGLGGVTEGNYSLRATFRPLEANSIVDVDGTSIDGDGDGVEGGVFDFWFKAAAPNGEDAGQRRSLFVDKATGSEAGDGSRATPFLNIDDAFAAAQPGDIVRIVGNGGADGLLATAGDNNAFEIGTGGLGNAPLGDGSTMNVPKGVTVMIDAGAVFKMGRSVIGVGSSTSSGDRSRSALQVLGTPEQQVFFTSYTDETLGVDTDPLTTTATPGDWGGIIFRNALDRAEGRFDAELDGRFVNYVGFADMRHGGGQVPVDGQNRVIAPLHMTNARPTLINNSITSSAFAAMSADPNSFLESTFNIPRFQSDAQFTPDYDRVGPDIRGNTVTENSINGLFVRIETAAGQNTAAQTVAAKWDDTDIVHVLADTLTVAGTPGGPLFEDTAPLLNTVAITSGGNVPGGQLTAGDSYSYRMTFVDANENESIASTATQPFTVPAGDNAIRLANLPSASAGFVGRRIYRSDDGGVTFRLVAELDRSSTTHVDSAAQRGTVANLSPTLNRARLDASLSIAPGVIVKSQTGRIVAGVSAQVVAEGTDGMPVIFTSRQDDRYGAGGTFDTNSDGAASQPTAGDWGGIYFSPVSTGSLDNTLITFGGGITSVGGDFSGVNAVEIQQASVRVANSVIENNAAGTGGSGDVNRNGLGFNEDAAIFVRGSQPVIVDNILRDNSGAAISIDAQSMSGNTVVDMGRATGQANRRAEITENRGPLLRSNSLGGNDVNAMVIRGATLTTESIWDDADIVHAVFDEILVPDLYVFGGLRLQSSPNESLVVKFGPGAGLTSNGRPLDIDDRIGGTLQVVGTPGFPVVLTSINDDSIGAGFDPDGRAQTDTNSDGTSTLPSGGDWRSLRIGEFSNDRNVAITTELEPAQSTGAGVNGIPTNAQPLGKLASSTKASDDNLRNGYTVVGTINNIDDIDVYSFEGTAGTLVWFDIDRTANSLDAVLELVDSDGNIIAQSDNSLDESTGALPIFNDPAAIPDFQVNPMQVTPQAPRNFGSGAAALGNTFADFYSTNPLDPGLRLVLPGASGSTNTYFVRVRSSNIDSRDPSANRADLQDPTKVSDGKTEGQYQLQLRLQALDETAGSSISFADIRFATAGIEILGGPAHSPLTGEAVELGTNNNGIANALDLGNLLNTDQAALSIAGDLNEDLDIDWYQFTINHDSLQDDGLTQHVAAMIDVDYADGLGRANTSLWLFYDDQNGIGGGTNTGIRLVNFGTDSSIADDRAAPLNGADTDDLSRGTAGILDAFIGTTQLPAGDYFLAITSNEQIANVLNQFYTADAGGNPLARVEPINSVTRIIEDRFGGSFTTAFPPTQVGFTGTENQVPYTLADIPLLISQRAPGADTSEFITASAITGTQTALVSRFGFVEDIAIRGDGIIHAARSPEGVVVNDANSGGILQIDRAGDGATTAVTTGSGIQTFELDFANNPPTVAQALTPGTGGQRQGVGMEFLGLTYPQEGNTQFLYAVGSRGNGATQFQTFTGITDARNYIYKLDPTSLQAISAPQQDRTDDGRIFGAGTQIVERGYIDTSIDRIQGASYQTIIMSDASPANAPSLLDGDLVTVRTPNGDFVFEWTAAQLSGTLIADTSPQSLVNSFPPAPTNFFQDGETFVITAGAVTNTFEIDSGRVIENNYPNAADLTTYDGTTFTIIDGDGDGMTFEFDNTGGGVVAGNIPVVYDAANSTQFQVSASIVASIRAANGGVPTAAGAGSDGVWNGSASLLPGTNRISLEGDTSVFLGSLNGGAFSAATNPNPLTISELTVNNALAPGQTFDGATFSITDADGDVFVFEFDTDNSVAAGNTPVSITDTSTVNFIATAIQSAINFPGGAAPPANWNVVAGNPFGGQIRLAGDALVTIDASTPTVVNPLSLTPEYGLVDGTLANIPVAIEEYFTNLDDIQFLPTPSTPGAMDELIAAINGSGMGVTASAVGTRLVLAGADAADFSLITSITTNTSTGGTNIPLAFNFTDSAAVLNNTLLTAIQAIEPQARFMADGRIWLPAQATFLQAGTDDRLDFPAKNATFSAPEYGFVTGIAFTGQQMFAVSQNGDLYRVGNGNFNPNSTQNNGDFIETIYNTNTGQRVNFVSVTSGPRNAENSINFGTNTGLDDVLFGLGSDGILYAFDTQGRPAHVFEDGAWFIQTGAGAGSGVALANLDVNLWHTTANNRNTDDGHGVNVSFDGSRRTQQQGGNSLYFGFENPQDATRQLGDWSGVNDPGANFPGYDPAIYDTYDFTGGARGSIVSNTLDLSPYGPADKPFLYFNYYLETEDANANNPTDPNFMKDSFRVFVAGDDGDWKLMATNNSDYDAQRLVGQRDELDYPFEEDFFATTRQVSELFEAGVNGAPDGWRQARIDLSRFAGEDSVRIRFDFSTSGSMDVGTAGAVELVAVAGEKIATGDTFIVGGVTFEFDFGLALQIPSGARLADGEFFEVDGTTFTFSSTSNAGTDVLFAPTDSAATVAARIAAKINALGLTATIDPLTPSRLTVIDAVNPTPAVSAGLPAGFIADVPGTAGVAVPVQPTMTSAEVRDAIRVAFAQTFNQPGQENNIDVVRFNADTIYLWNKTIQDPGPLGSSTFLQGDEFGESISGATNQVGRGAQRLQQNRFEGVYVDDIIVGFAERGEMVTYQDNGTASDTSFTVNPRYEPAPGFTEILTGTYQIEIRRGATYGIGGTAFPSLGLVQSFDTNHRHAQQTTLIAPSGSEIADGQTFALSDGINTLTFEFDDTSITTGPFFGVAQGNVRVPFSSADLATDVAISIRDAVNASQGSFNIVAGLSDATDSGTGTLGKASGSRAVDLHGVVAAGNFGEEGFIGSRQATITDATQAGYVLYGIDIFKPTEVGDSNRLREQGQIIVHSNIVRDSSTFGIFVDAGARTNNSLIPLAGALPRPGSVRNLVQFNQQDLVPGPVIINNLVYANAVGGILFSGDQRNANSPEAPTPFGRIINNTVVGLNGGGVGISVTDNASPTLLNNIVSSLATGINVDASSASTVLGATTYQNNGTNKTGVGGLGTDPQVLGPTEPLFVNAAGRNYYLADGTRAIDSSVDSLNDRQAMTTVRDPLGIAVSPILAPEFDLTGQLRVDDPDISNPNGTGGNPFKDRGAYDRADFFGPIAQIQQPLDNDPDNVDSDRTNTFIQLKEGEFEALDFFSILLFEEQGTGPDATTVTSDAVTVTENGRLLRAGTDYIFGYNPSSRLIRLTPFSGIWRNDSVYEITLNNRDGIRIELPSGADISDGDSFTANANGTTHTFEFDSNGTVASGAIALPFSPSSSSYDVTAQVMSAFRSLGFLAYLQGDGAVMVHGVDSVLNVASTAVGAITDVAGNLLQANRITSLTQFTIIMPEVALDYGDAPGTNSRTVMTDGSGSRSIDVSRHALLPVDAAPLTLGTYADSEADGQPSTSARGDDAATAAISTTVPSSFVSISGGAVVQMQPVGAATDGQHFTVIDPLAQLVTFEFDTAPAPGSVAAGRFRVPVTVGDSAAIAAEKLRAAINAAVIEGRIEGLSPSVSGINVDLGGSSQHAFNFSSASLALTQLSQSDFVLSMSSDIADYADGNQVTVTDAVGRTAIFELEDLSAGSVGVSVGVVPVPVDLAVATPEDVATAFAAAINLEIAARRLTLAPVTVAGTALTISADDEEGVSFGGLFNANSKPVPVSIDVTGSGILDVWFDWNGDGDFSDAGEKISSASSLPVQTGRTTLLIETPDVAQTAAEAFQTTNPGERFFVASRFRLSTNGTSLLGAVGIGGEVEDYMVEIVTGAPPVAVDDNFEVLEDQVLVVNPSGVLTNDIDPDNLTTDLEVVDEDSSTPEIEPVKDVDFGTLVLNRDGSFTYTPTEDFFGIDTFVYNITDPRLLSEQAATVTITVHEINDTPTAVDDEITLFEDQDVTRPAADFTVNDFKGRLGFGSQINELGQTLTIVNASILSPNPSVFGGSVTIVGNDLVITPPPHYNSEIDGPMLVALTIQDDGQSWDTATSMLVDDFKSAVSTLTINLTALNDSPEFDMLPGVGVTEDAGPQVINPFITSILPGPAGATDEAIGPGSSPEDQQVSFTATALDPSLFVSGPTIDASGTLSFELQPDVNNAAPYPSEILVEVVATDTGSGEAILRNLFDPAAVTGTATYDGTTLAVTDTAGNIVVFEFDDVNFPGVGTTGGVPHMAIPFDAATDTAASIEAALLSALNTPDAASINGAGPWGVEAFVDNVTGEIRLTGEASTVVTAGPALRFLNNLFTGLAAGETYDGATFTISDADGDSITFELNDTTDTAPATPGVAAGNAAIDYDPSFTQNQLSQAISDAINAPPAAILAGLAGTWDVTSTLAVGTDRMQLSGAASVSLAASATPIINPLGSETIAVESPIDARPAHDSVVRTFTITVESVNDAPVFEFNENPINLLEDAGSVMFVDFLINAAAGPDSAVDELASQSLTLTVTAIDPTAFTTLPSVVFDAATGTADLMFETAPDVNSESGHDLRVLVTLMDDGGTAHPLSIDTTVQTLTLSVTPVNDAPSFDIPSPEVTVLEDNESVTGATPTTIVGFASNVAVGPATALDETTLPATMQSPTFVTVSVSDPSLFAVQPQITATGDLVFETAPNQNGQAIVVVHLLDSGADGTTGNGDENQSVPDQTFTINITPVNDAPEFTIPLVVSSFEDQGPVQVANFATDLRPGPATATDEVGQEFTVHVEALDPTAFTVLPEIGADGTLTFQTAPDVNENNADLRVRVFLTDNGVAGPAPDTNRSPDVTFTIATAPINDAPQFTLASTRVEVIEDIEQFNGTTITSFPAFASNIMPGPATATDEALQNVTFEVVSVTAPELFDIQPEVSVTGELTFKTSLHKNGNAIVVLRAIDDGVSTPPPNDNDSVLRTITIAVTPVNDAPQFSVPSTLTVNEDAGLVSEGSFATGVRRGPPGTDDENGQLIQFEVTASDPSSFAVQPAITADGTLTFQTAPNVNSLNANLEVTVQLMDNGASSPAPNQNASGVSTFTITVNAVNDPPIADAFTASGLEDQSIVILSADVLVGDIPGPTADESAQSLAITQIERTSVNGGTIVPVFSGPNIVSFTYTPPANLVGTDTFLYVVTDDGTPARSGSGTITIALTGINDPPQFVKGANQIVPEDADLITLENWATGILAGPPAAADEIASQTVTFTATANNTGLFEVQPSVTSDGTLSFKPSKDANGVAVVTVIATDDGASDAPNNNTSVSQTFTITVNPVNDAPAFTAGGDVAVDEDSGTYSAAWASGIVPAAGLLDTPATATDESAQIVDFVVTADSPALFSVQPTINNSGELQFTPAGNAFGTAVLTVVAVDRGPAGGLDQNSSAPQLLTVTINPVNDAPEGAADSFNTNENEVLSVPAPGVLVNDTDVDLPNDTLMAVAETVTSALGAEVTINADGSISYDPSEVTAIQQLTTGQNVLDTFVYRVSDTAGTLSTPTTVSINVAGIDDAPVAVDDNYSMGVGQNRLLDILVNDSDIDSTIDPRTITITQIPIFGTAVVNQTGVIEYTAGSGFRGVDTLGYTVRDAAGNLSNEALVTITINNAPTAQDDSTFTFKNEPIDIDVLSNDSDFDGTIDPTTVEVVVAPNPGGTTEVLPDGKIRFTPAADFAGEVQFSYVVSDDTGTTSNVADVLVRVQNSKWQNPQGNLDVNGDGFVSPIDALIIINYLNGGNEQFLPDSGVLPPPYLDPSGDETVAPLDALIVINFLNQNSSGGGGEGEAPLMSEEHVMMVTPMQIIETVGPQIVSEIRKAMDDVLAAELDEATEVSTFGPARPSAMAFVASDDEIDPLDALVCSHDELASASDEDISTEATDEFFSDIGPHLPR